VVRSDTLPAVPTDPTTRRRRIGIAALVATVLVFIIELVALALGQLEVAAACFAVFVVGWFALRSWMKRTGGSPG
jgi:hypothetical protein